MPFVNTCCSLAQYFSLGGNELAASKPFTRARPALAEDGDFIILVDDCRFSQFISSTAVRQRAAKSIARGKCNVCHCLVIHFLCVVYCWDYGIIIHAVSGTVFLFDCLFVCLFLWCGCLCGVGWGCLFVALLLFICLFVCLLTCLLACLLFRVRLNSSELSL